MALGDVSSSPHDGNDMLSLLFRSNPLIEKGTPAVGSGGDVPRGIVGLLLFLFVVVIDEMEKIWNLMCRHQRRNPMHRNFEVSIFWYQRSRSCTYVISYIHNIFLPPYDIHIICI
jgi:hypothetical protein